jgi:hypothetical protein
MILNSGSANAPVDKGVSCTVVVIVVVVVVDVVCVVVEYVTWDVVGVDDELSVMFTATFVCPDSAVPTDEVGVTVDELAWVGNWNASIVPDVGDDIG